MASRQNVSLSKKFQQMPMNQMRDTSNINGIINETEREWRHETLLSSQ